MADILTNIIKITDSAAAEIRNLLQSPGLPEGSLLRVGVKGGGCSGLSYILDFDVKKALDDVHVINGVQVLIDKRHAMYLMGMEVDYQSGLNDRGFIFNNPNAQETCGCGTSFSV